MSAEFIPEVFRSEIEKVFRHQYFIELKPDVAASICNELKRGYYQGIREGAFVSPRTKRLANLANKMYHSQENGSVPLSFSDRDLIADIVCERPELLEQLDDGLSHSVECTIPSIVNARQ